jgi:hypothetical protein
MEIFGINIITLFGEKHFGGIVNGSGIDEN